MIDINKTLVSTKAFFRRRFVKRGLPFIVFMLIMPFGLKNFTSLRYEYSKKKFITPEELEKEGIKMKKPEEITVEKQYEKLKDLDINNWEQVRIPRPWDETIN